MKHVDSSVISEPVEFIFNLSNVSVTKDFLLSPMKLSNLSQTHCIFEIIIKLLITFHTLCQRLVSPVTAQWLSTCFKKRTARVRVNGSIGPSRTFKEGLPRVPSISSLPFTI